MPEVRFVCEFCSEASFYSEDLCLKHEAVCPVNPANRTCITCRFLHLGAYHRKTFDCKARGVRVSWQEHCPVWEAK